MKLSNNGDVFEHMIVHTGENKYKCSFCEKVFLHTSALKLHMKIHIENTSKTNTFRIEINECLVVSISVRIVIKETYDSHTGEKIP